MRPVDNKHYIEPAEYHKAIGDLTVYSGFVLSSLAEHPEGVREVIIGNFIARGITFLHSVQVLWKLRHFQDAYALYRCLLDRFFHLAALSEDDSFELFEQWSFVQQYEMRNRALSDADVKDSLDPAFWHPTEEQRARYCELKKINPMWRRPRAEIVAKRMELEILYKYGYDYGSTHVHPMANDGDEDFLRLTGSGPDYVGPDQRVLLNNACLVTGLLIREGIHASHLGWRSMMFDFLDAFTRHLGTGAGKHRGILAKISAVHGQGGVLCKKMAIS